MKNVLVAMVLIFVGLAGCTESDADSNAGQELPPLEDSQGRKWDDRELWPGVNPEFAWTEESPEFSIDHPNGTFAPGQITVTGTVSRESAVFVGLFSRDRCREFQDLAPRIIANGTWTHTFDDPGIGEYTFGGISFGRDENGTLDGTVGLQLFEQNPNTNYGEYAWPEGFQIAYKATVSIEFGDQSNNEPLEDSVSVYGYHAKEYYVAEDDDSDCPTADRPDFINVHDVLVAWEEQRGHTIIYSYNEDFNSFSVDVIDGEGQGLAGAPPWWCYTLNGDGEGVAGITLQRFTPGDHIHWDLGTCPQGIMT